MNISNSDPKDIPTEARGYESFPGAIGQTLADSAPAWPQVRKAPSESPNVVFVMVDDMGYSDIGPFGSEIDTPALHKIADAGVRFSNYHTAPACSPARAAALTGLNPHRAGFGYVAVVDPGFPNLRMEIAGDVCTMPEILRDAGYATFAVGKWHLTGDNQLHDAADKSSWPLQRGFDKYYGSMEGMNTFFHPNRMISDNSAVEFAENPDDYYLTDDLTDRADAMIKSLRASDPSKPFFLYFAHVAMHGPLGAKQDDIDKYRGSYAQGWDRLRERRLASQKESGLFPADLQLPHRSEAGLEVKEWDQLGSDEQDRFARYMEVYAAMVDSIDQSLKKIMKTLEDLGELDNTIIVFTSDNGGSQEGGPEGTRSYFSQFIHGLGLPKDWENDSAIDPDLIGGPRTMAHYPRGWGMVSNTPFRYYKTWCHAGGVRVPFIVSWPAGARRGLVDPGTRDHYQYVTDILPTILSLAGVTHPGTRNGRVAKTVDGVDFSQVLSDGTASSRHTEQYSELGGQRGFYRDGWKIVAAHDPSASIDDEEWELYDIESDPNELHNLAAEHPDRVDDLAEAWQQAAWKNTVFPMLTGDPIAAARRRPDEAFLAEPVRLLPGTPKLERYRSAKLVQLRSFDVVIALDRRLGGEGVLLAHGDQGGGYSIFVEDDRLSLAFNEYGRLRVVSSDNLPRDLLNVCLRVKAGDNFQWSLQLLVNDRPVAQLDPVQMLLGVAPFSGIEVGRNTGGPVHWELYQKHGAFPFDGDLHSVTYIPGDPVDYDPETIAAAQLDSAIYYD